MKRALAPVGVMVLLLALSGCVNVEASESRIDVTPAASGTYSDGDATVVVEPSEPSAAPVEASTTPEPPTKASEMLVAIQLTVTGYGVDVTTDQIKSAADYTCDQLAAGADQGGIVALTGDVPERANEALVQMAADEYCGIR